MLAWIVGLFMVGGFGYAAWRAYGKWLDRQRAAEARMASLVAQMKAGAPAAQAVAPSQPAAAPAAAPRMETDVQERLLFEAADKAGQAGEPALAIQLYARLVSRYPQSGLAPLARAAVAEQKKKLAKA